MTPFDKLIKVQIAQPGMQTYTGYIRGHRFVDGKSFEAIPVRAALLLGASCKVQDMDGNIISPNTYKFEDAEKVSAADTPPSSVPKVAVVEPEVDADMAAHLSEQPTDEVEDANVDFYVPNEEMEAATLWTREDLETIADRDGIQGLRDIGGEFEVKERSINGLIDAILKAQDGVTKFAGEE